MSTGTDAETSGDDSYDPKHKDLRLTRGEKCIIAMGSLFVVILLVLIRHPELYRNEHTGNQRGPGPSKSASIDKLIGDSPGGLGDLIRGHASSDGTTGFADKNQKSFSYNIDTNGLMLSAIGIGTYLGEPTSEVDKQIEDAIFASVSQGVNVIDSAINYRGMRSERSIKRGLKKVFEAGIASRHSLFVSTKAGFIPADAEEGISPRRMASEWSAALEIREDIVDGKHCIAPACLNSSLHYSRQNLGLETIDLLYLHNVGEKQLDSVSFEDVMGRLEEAFVFLEEQRKLHYIRYYGLATWTSFRTVIGSHAHLPLRDIVDLAVQIGGEDHGFRYVQLPVTVAMPEAATAVYDKVDTVTRTFLETAAELKINVMTSRSIGTAKPADLDQVEKLYKQCMDEESEWGPTALRRATGGPPLGMASLSLLITRSVPGVVTALVGMKSPDHVKQNLALMSVHPMPKEVIIDCVFKSAPGAQKVEQFDVESSEAGRWHLRHSKGKRDGKSVEGRGKGKLGPKHGPQQEGLESERGVVGEEEGRGDHDRIGAKQRRKRGGKRKPKGKSINDVFNT